MKLGNFELSDWKYYDQECVIYVNNNPRLTAIFIYNTNNLFNNQQFVIESDFELAEYNKYFKQLDKFSNIEDAKIAASKLIDKLSKMEAFL